MKVIERCVSEKDDSEEWLLMSLEERQHTIDSVKWIPVTERLPDNTRTVLTTFIESGVVKVDTLHYFREPLGWTDFRYNEELGRPKSYEVTAWMELPEPWRGEEDE